MVNLRSLPRRPADRLTLAGALVVVCGTLGRTWGGPITTVDVLLVAVGLVLVAIGIGMILCDQKPSRTPGLRPASLVTWAGVFVAMMGSLDRTGGVTKVIFFLVWAAGALLLAIGMTLHWAGDQSTRTSDGARR